MAALERAWERYHERVKAIARGGLDAPVKMKISNALDRQGREIIELGSNLQAGCAKAPPGNERGFGALGNHDAKTCQTTVIPNRSPGAPLYRWAVETPDGD